MMYTYQHFYYSFVFLQTSFKELYRDISIEVELEMDVSGLMTKLNLFLASRTDVA